MFIELDANGNVLAAADFRFSDSCVETEEEIVRGDDGKLYFLGSEPEGDEISRLKREIILKKQAELEKTFYSSYPLHKQCNIGIFGNEEEREAFEEFHHSHVSTFDAFVNLVEGCITLAELQTYGDS
jgi:hypothetical protein